MKNAKLNERVRIYSDGYGVNGSIIEVGVNRFIKVKWDDDSTTTEHESQLIRLRPKKKVTRDALVVFWNDRIYKNTHHFKADASRLFNELCELVGVK